MNYEEDIKIDEQALDVECLEQSAKMMKYTRHQASCEREKDRAKTALDLIEAELDRKIRINPEKYKIEKITDKVVSNTILLQDAYKKANEDYLTAKYEWGVAKGSVDAFQDRKAMLESLVRLHGQSYFAGPAVPHDISTQRNLAKEKDKEMNERIANRIQRRTKS